MTPTVRPVAPACGADIDGLDLSEPTPDAIDLVRTALADHGVVFVRDQRLDPVQQVRLTAMFGDKGRQHAPFIGEPVARPQIT